MPMSRRTTTEPAGEQTAVIRSRPAQKITPCLWFDSNAEEAVEFYTSIFENSRITGMTRYGEAGAQAAQRPAGSVMTILFQLQGQEFMALNGGPVFMFSPAVSFMVNCQTQEEIDDLWTRLSEGGEIIECGWLKDRFGLSWQIVPTVLGEMLQDPDPVKTEHVMQAMLQMKKIDIAALEQAYRQ
jgi:predicted 3-demethylubiquinone-9 3-methyltransferase (glyoxalase superfamily)